MTHNNDVDKILQNLKKSYPNSTPAAPAKTNGMTGDRLSEIIAREAAAKSAAQSAPAQTAVTKPQPVTQTETQKAEAHEIESEFFSKLATALKENPAVADLVEEVDENLEEKNRNTVSITAASYVDEKFVDFFTTTVAVERQPTSEIVVKRKTGGFFRKKYITDSLTLSIPQEEVDKRQQKVAKPSTAELARNIILGTAQPAAEKPQVVPKNVAPKATEKTAQVETAQETAPKGLFGRKKAEKTQQPAEDMPLFMRYKTDEIPADAAKFAAEAIDKKENTVWL